MLQGTLSLPKLPPAGLSQILIPRLQFNRHKPSSIEGEEWLDSKGSAVNKINMRVDLHSPDTPETVVEQSQANEYREWLQGTIHNPCGPSLLWICTDREPFCGAKREVVDGPGAEISHSICDRDIVNRKNEKSVLIHSLKPEMVLCPRAAAALQVPPLSPRPSAQATGSHKASTLHSPTSTCRLHVDSKYSTWSLCGVYVDLDSYMVCIK
jgi:hypothetical protein